MINTEIDALIRTQVASDGPGVAVAVLRKGQMIHSQGYGLANLEWELPITSRTAFGLGSLTKPFTATAIILLEKQGKLRLDDPIQNYLPDYPKQKHPITLTHLLTHTSGIPNFITMPGFWENHAQIEKTVAKVIALFKDHPLDFEPGTRYSYSNSGYVLLGHIMERLLDIEYEEVIQRLIFDPLHMGHSYYLRQERIIPNRASGYTKHNDKYQNALLTTAEVKHAAGGLASTLEDLLLWDEALREQRLLDNATQARMYAPVQLADGSYENYGLGWGIGTYRQHHFICHAGGIPGFSSFFGRFSKDHLTIILLSNNGWFDGGGLARKISQLLLDLPEPLYTPVSIGSQVRRKVVGAYSSVFGTLEVKEEEQTLYVHNWTKYALVPTSETSFYSADDGDVTIFFEKPNEQGDYTQIRIIMPFFWFTATRTGNTERIV